MPTRRQDRVSQQIHRELSSLLMLEARDERLAGVTITDVDITKDLELARVHFVTLGDEEETLAALAALRHASGFLRSQLAARLRLRSMPELVFAVDRSGEYGQRIDRVLDRLKDGRSDSSFPNGRPGGESGSE